VLLPQSTVLDLQTGVTDVEHLMSLLALPVLHIAIHTTDNQWSK